MKLGAPSESRVLICEEVDKWDLVKDGHCLFSAPCSLPDGTYERQGSYQKALRNSRHVRHFFSSAARYFYKSFEKEANVTDAFGLVLALAAGIGIGAFYFGGLLWTIQKLPERRRPGLWVTASYFIRTAIAVFAFYLVMSGHWQRLLVSLLGFIVIRIVLVRRMKPAKAVNSDQ